MAAIFADAAVFGYKALSKESSSLSYDEKSTLSPELWSDLKPQDPCPCSKQDFIVFAEFSEVMGPIPLLTIPLHTAEKSGIEINNFIMRVMSVDYQANPSQSVFCEDAQVLRLFVMPDVHAYVHYLTLHDPGARGFVRPLCLAYVTADQYKLSQLFPKLRNQFLQIDADENLAVIDRWKHGFEEANKSDMIFSVYSITSRIGNNTNHLKGILALSPWGFSAAIWNLLSLLISHHECRLTQYPTPVSLQDWVCD
ncbi:hypothetical protein C0J52_17890 [Blattella germanica]|nr:hypothetical protein C0J52_17890 [Blattella germanica]